MPDRHQRTDTDGTEMMHRRTQFDVVVVGGGGSGLAAAARCAELGMSVAVLEKQQQPGGTTGIAVGSFTANRTKLQQRAGITDSLDDHVADTGKFAEGAIEERNNVELRRYFLDEAAETLNWLTGLGLNFHGPSPEPPNRVPRMHNVVPNAKAYVAALQASLQRHGGELHCGTSVKQLQFDDCRVTGVVAETESECVRYSAARGVVLAAGDYANSQSMIERFKGSQFAAIDGINCYALGDGHILAEQAGARLINMDVTYGPELRFVPPPTKHDVFAQLLPVNGIGARIAGKLLPLVPRRLIHAYIKRLLVTWQHPEDSLFSDGAILINREGRRFCNECDWPSREIAVAQQPGKVGFIAMDQRLIEKFSAWPHFISTAPEIAYAYVADYLRLRPDVAVTASTLSGLCEARNLPIGSLDQTIAETNKARLSKRRAPLQGNRWVLLGPVRAYFTTTEGGAAINQKLEVLDDENRSIPGLYAIGQNGLGGQILWGHGLHIAWAMTSGRLVAEHLAKQL